MRKPEKISDEAMYRILHQRLNGHLRKRFEIYQNRMTDGFEDIVDDFFLYLRDGKNGTNRIKYESLYRIKNPKAFSAFIINTFRNYLSVKAAKEVKFAYAERSADNIAGDETASSFLTDEQKLAIASNLIAYAHQTLLPRDCFILFRSLLTMLNKKQALPY